MQQLSPLLRKDVGWRNIDGYLIVREQRLSEVQYLRQGIDGILLRLPSVVIHLVLEIKPGKAERLVIIAVQTDFPAVIQQQGAEMVEALLIALPWEKAVHLVAVILNNHSGIPHPVIVTELQHIRPPDIGVKAGDIPVVVPADILSVPHGNRGGKVVQEKRGGVDDRVHTGIFQ